MTQDENPRLEENPMTHDGNPITQDKNPITQDENPMTQDEKPRNINSPITPQQN